MGVGHDGGPYMTSAESRADVVVVGGGLAGISAAVDLAEAGLRVTVLEARPWLGGATCSFARRGLTIDNGQHAFLRCYRAYRDLLAKLGVTSSVAIQDRLELTVLRPAAPGPAAQGPAAQLTLRRSGLPAPLHLARALAGYRLLSKAERVKAAAAIAALRFAGLGGSDADDISLGEWLASRGQDENARRLFWDLLSAAALSLPADEADLMLAVSAIRAAVLSGRANADIGVPATSLSKLHSDPAATLLSRLGARVVLGVKAAGIRTSTRGGYDIRLEPAGPGNQGPVLGLPEAIHAAGLVLAVPAWEAAALAPAELSGEAARWARLEAAPVLSLHVIYGSRVTRLPYAAVVDSPVRWIIDKTGPAGLRTGQYLAACVPAADSYVDLAASQLRVELLPELERLFPAATDAEVQDFFITRERRALIRQVPGSRQLRASQPAGLPGFALAGAWTDTGWPDTMEGAVRSGHGAALKVLGELAASGQIASAAAIAPDGPVASMARAI
jgi:squalene-associated FAD-dependent desaturase